MAACSDESDAAIQQQQQQQVATKARVSFSDAIHDFRSTRIEEVICYRFDQFDTAAQLLLKLASVACANGEVFSLQLLDFMIQEESSVMSAFACLHTISTADGEDGYGEIGDGNRGIDLEEGGEAEDTVGFEPEERTSIRTGTTLLGLCQ